MVIVTYKGFEYLGNKRGYDKPYFGADNKSNPLKFENKEDAYSYVKCLDYGDCTADKVEYVDDTK